MLFCQIHFGAQSRIRLSRCSARNLQLLSELAACARCFCTFIDDVRTSLMTPITEKAEGLIPRLEYLRAKEQSPF